MRLQSTCVSAPAPQLIELAAGAVWSGEFEHSVRVSVHAGTVWLTRSGDATDYVLSASQEQAFAGEGAKFVLQALEGRAVFEVC